MCFASDIFKFLTYADDTTLFVTLNSIGSSENQCPEDSLNKELVKVTDWLKLNKLSLNTEKTKCMIYRPVNKRIQTPKTKL